MALVLDELYYKEKKRKFNHCMYKMLWKSFPLKQFLITDQNDETFDYFKREKIGGQAEHISCNQQLIKLGKHFF